METRTINEKLKKEKPKLKNKNEETKGNKPKTKIKSTNWITKENNKKENWKLNKHVSSSVSCAGVFGNTKLLSIFLLITSFEIA